MPITIRIVLLTITVVTTLMIREYAMADPPALLKAPFEGEAARTRQAEWADDLKCDIVARNSIGINLVLIPAGEYTLGSSEPLSELVVEFRPPAGFSPANT